MLNSIFNQVEDVAAALMVAYHDSDLCHQYAWWIVEAVTQKNRAQLLTERNFCLSADQEKKLAEWIRLIRDDHMPLPYLLGTVPFLNLTLAIEPPILIPRPETEEWVSYLIKKLQPLAEKPLTILDLCSGSGCIALALAQALPNARVIGVDIDDQAIDLAHRNASTNLVGNVHFIQSDLYPALPNDQRYDLIVSNPPYISTMAWHTLERSVKDWESYHALVAEDNGCALIETIIANAHRFIRSNVLIDEHLEANIFIEIAYDQASRIAHCMKNSMIDNVNIYKDGAGKDRMVSGRVVHVVSAITQE